MARSPTELGDILRITAAGKSLWGSWLMDRSAVRRAVCWMVCARPSEGPRHRGSPPVTTDAL